MAIKNVPIYLPYYPKVAMAAVWQNPDAIELIPKYLADYEEIRLSANQKAQQNLVAQEAAKAKEAKPKNITPGISSNEVFKQLTSVFRGNQSESQPAATKAAGGGKTNSSDKKLTR
jgi:hypothetical protein